MLELQTEVQIVFRRRVEAAHQRCPLWLWFILVRQLHEHSIQEEERHLWLRAEQLGRSYWSCSLPGLAIASESWFVSWSEKADFSKLHPPNNCTWRTCRRKVNKVRLWHAYSTSWASRCTLWLIYWQTSLKRLPPRRCEICWSKAAAIICIIIGAKSNRKTIKPQ